MSAPSLPLSAARAPTLSGVSQPPPDFTAAERALLLRYLTNLDHRVFALKGLPQVVAGALFSRYSRTEKSLRRVLLDEFLDEPDLGIGAPEPDATIDKARAEAFYERVLVGYGDDSVAELAFAHVAVERVSQLAAKALEDARIGISPLEKSTRYVRFDRTGPDGRFAYHRGPELDDPRYEPAMERLFTAFAELLPGVLEGVRARHARREGEPEGGWRRATRAHAFDLLRGLLPAATLTNLGLAGSGRAFEYLLTRMAAAPLPEVSGLATELHTELREVLPAFVRRALDERYGGPAASRLRARAAALAAQTPTGGPAREEDGVLLVDYDRDAEHRVAAALVFAGSDLPLDRLLDADLSLPDLLATVAEARQNRRDRLPRAFEHAAYTFQITANFGAYRDLQRHRMLTQERQRLTTALGFDVPAELHEYGAGRRFEEEMVRAGEAHRALVQSLGPDLAQYAVPLAFRLRWYARVNLRELCHLAELRTTQQGHPDYRQVAQRMFQQAAEVHPELCSVIKFVDLEPGAELARRASERRSAERLSALDQTR